MPELTAIPTSDERPILLADDIQHIFRLGSPSAAYRLMRSGDIPVLRVGKRVYVPTAELRSMLGMSA